MYYDLIVNLDFVDIEVSKTNKRQSKGMQSSLRHIERHKHKPRAERKTKRRKRLVLLYLQVPEDKSCFVFVSILCLCRQCEPGFTRCQQLINIDDFKRFQGYRRRHIEMGKNEKHRMFSNVNIQSIF